jgi:hypothetical protein
MRRSLLVASFEEEESFVRAAKAVASEGVRIQDAYGPYPVHGLESAMALRDSRLSWVTLAAGLAGLIGAMVFQFYAAVLDWPMNVGGKPANSTLAFIPITFEVTVLLAGLATVAAFLVVSRLFPRTGVRPIVEGVTEDRFALVLRKAKAGIDWSDVRRLLEEYGAIDVHISEAGA